MAITEISFDDITSKVGEELGSSEWHIVTQDEVNTFADVTFDHQWIHIDTERSAKESPYGGTVVHGYFTLSLIPHLMSQVWRVTGSKMGVNYGLNKVRFPAPVPVGKKVRATATLASAKEVEGGYQLEVNVRIDVEGSEKPCCVAQTVSRVYG